MKYAIISDIHSSLEALQSVLDKIDTLNPDTMICLGDIVGYGASPNECIDIIRERGITSIIGNHDRVAAGIAEPENFNPDARQAALWTRDALTPGNRRFLAELPNEMDFENFKAVHGAISDPDKYIVYANHAESEFFLLGEFNVCFFGHTHISTIFIKTDNKVDRRVEETIKIEGQTKYMINPGSVGQPRDRDARASFVIYDDALGHAQYYRVDYDIERAQRKILSAGLSEFLARRLNSGI